MPSVLNTLPPGRSSVARDEVHRVDASTRSACRSGRRRCRTGRTPPPRGVAARSRASARTVAGSMPVRGAVASGVNGWLSRSQPIHSVGLRFHAFAIDEALGEHAPAAATAASRRRRRGRCPAIRTGPRSRSCADRSTTTRPPRLTMSCMRSLIRGAVEKLPCETTGSRPSSPAGRCAPDRVSAPPSATP